MNLKKTVETAFATGLARLLGVRVKGATEEPAGTSIRPNLSLIETLGGKLSKVGLRVNPEVARQCAAVYKCVRILSETLANLPLQIFERIEDGKEPAYKHPLYPLLHDAPNAHQTSFEWREMGMGHQCLRGNFTNSINRNGVGEVVEIVPFHPDRFTLYQDSDGDLLYHVQPMRGEATTLLETSVLHIRGMSGDGLLGYSPINLLRESVGLALGGEEFAARTLQSGARLSGFLKLPEAMDEEDAKRLEQQFREQKAGLSNAGGIAVFDAGMEWVELGMTAVDAQILDSRKYEALNLYGVYGVPPHMVGETEKATSWGTGIEQQTIGFMTFTMLAHGRRHEQRYKLSLLTPAERERFFIEFNLNNVVRGDIKSRYAAYAVGRQWGWLSVNDIRRFENMNPIPDGDIYLQPLNMVEAGTPTLDDEERLAEETEQSLDRASDYVYSEVHGKTTINLVQSAVPRYRAIEVPRPAPAMSPARMQQYHAALKR